MDLSILRTIRKGKNLKQKDVSGPAGISQAYLSLIERNIQDPQSGDLERICSVLGLELCITLKT